MSFSGNRVKVDALRPTIQDVEESLTTTVDSSVEVNNSLILSGVEWIDIDIASSSIDISADPNQTDGYRVSGSGISDFRFTHNSFAGFSFSDVDNTIPDILGIRVSTTDVDDPAFDSSDVTFDADTIYVNVSDVWLVQTETEQSVITIDVNFAAPVAQDDSAGTAFATAAVIDVLDNDSDADGTLDASTVAVTGQGTKGTAEVNPDGTITYTPDGLQNGEDSFTYTVADDFGTASNEATVTVTIAPNQPPTATDDGYTAAEDDILTVTAANGVLANDSDPDGQTLTASLVTGPDHGDLTLEADGSFTYTPDPDFNGTDSFTYAASDGDFTTDPATVTLTVDPVNDPPVATDDGYAIAEDNVLTVTAAFSVLDNDGDPDNDPLHASVATGPANGDLALNPDGSFTYTPDIDFFGQDSFTYTASDGELTSEPATVEITVTPVNDAPVATDDSYTVYEDIVVIVSAAAGVLHNDSDVDGDPLAAIPVLTTGPNDGDLILNPNGSFTYTPDPDFFGTDSFTYTAFDGQEASQPALVTLTVTPVNDAPFAANDTAETSLLTATTIDVLVNDTDIDGTLDPTSVTVTGDPANGTATANPDGTITYTPGFLFSGQDSFTYTVADNEGAASNAATVAVTVALDQNPVTGTGGLDYRSGTGNADLIQTLGGNDIVRAQGGDDIVLGGAGRDSLYGDAGNDLLMGGAGNDVLTGGAGNDILVGGPGNDGLMGGSGLDTAIFAGAFADHRIIGNGSAYRSVEDQAGDGGRDTLTSVELLQFDDGFFDARSGQFTEGAFATPEVEALVTSPGFIADPEPILAPVV